MVIEFDGKGHELDFRAIDKQGLICLQNNMKYAFANVQVRPIGQGFDYLNGTYKYIHTIDTDCGDSGLLVAHSIYVCNHNLLKDEIITCLSGLMSA